MPLPVTFETGVYSGAWIVRADQAEGCGVGGDCFWLKRRKRGAAAPLLAFLGLKFDGRELQRVDFEVEFVYIDSENMCKAQMSNCDKKGRIE